MVVGVAEDRKVSDEADWGRVGRGSQMRVGKERAGPGSQGGGVVGGGGWRRAVGVGGGRGDKKRVGTSGGGRREGRRKEETRVVSDALGRPEKARRG